ncbi:MAG: hypothetical protein GC181_08875 [Bacteroidetes bacterium]|nr:hypothetical protein [Bacteroidota bacterium]
MKTTLIKTTVLLGISITVMSFDNATAWFKAGSQPKSYEMGIDKGTGINGANAASIKSKEKKIDGFGTLMQQCLPGKYLGKRIRMSGYLKSENVQSWAGFWLRVDQSGSNDPLSFDNMSNRPITGTTEWKKYDLVLDVPETASKLAYGALLHGTGQIWFTNITFEIVSDSIPTTGDRGINTSLTQKEPTNLNFEK